MIEAPSDVARSLEQILASVVALRSDVVTNGDALLDDWRPRIQRPTFQAAGCAPCIPGRICSTMRRIIPMAVRRRAKKERSHEDTIISSKPEPPHCS